MNISELTYYVQSVSEYFKRHEVPKIEVSNGNWLIVRDDADNFRAVCQDFETQEKIQVIDLGNSGTLSEGTLLRDEGKQPPKIIQLYPNQERG